MFQMHKVVENIIQSVVQRCSEKKIVRTVYTKKGEKKDIKQTKEINTNLRTDNIQSRRGSNDSSDRLKMG